VSLAWPNRRLPAPVEQPPRDTLQIRSRRACWASSAAGQQNVLGAAAGEHVLQLDLCWDQAGFGCGNVIGLGADPQRASLAFSTRQGGACLQGSDLSAVPVRE